MPMTRSETLPIRSEPDVVLARQEVRRRAAELRFSLIDQTKMVTAASELARNTLIYGGGGEMLLEVLEEGSRTGIRLSFIDTGPGIPDIEAAMTDGFTTGTGLGLGLGGAKRLANEFDIVSSPGQGTRVTICRWK